MCQKLLKTEGEIYIGSAGMTQWYINAKQLHEEIPIAAAILIAIWPGEDPTMISLVEEYKTNFEVMALGLLEVLNEIPEGSDFTIFTHDKYIENVIARHANWKKNPKAALAKVKYPEVWGTIFERLDHLTYKVEFKMTNANTRKCSYEAHSLLRMPIGEWKKKPHQQS